jgi:hypothetical protein
MTCSRRPSPPLLQNLIFSTHNQYNFGYDAQSGDYVNMMSKVGHDVTS